MWKTKKTYFAIIFWIKSYCCISASSAFLYQTFCSDILRSWIQSPDQVVLGLFVTNVVVFLFSKAADDQFLTKHFKVRV